MRRKKPDDKTQMVVRKPPEIEGTPVKFWKENGELRKVSDPKRIGDDYKAIIGTQDTEIADDIFAHTVVALDPAAKEHAVNVAIQSLYEQKPKSAIEARLISQATALYAQGMNCLSNAVELGDSKSGQYRAHMAVKFLRLHNETIEALDRHRRGGEQKVIVTHIAEKMAVVNNFVVQGGGVSYEKKGDSPCLESAGLRRDQTMVNHADNHQWQMADADSTEEKAPARAPKKAGEE